MERRSPSPPGLQWKLPLPAPDPFQLPPGPQGELTLALAELLIQAARHSLGLATFSLPSPNGDADE